MRPSVVSCCTADKDDHISLLTGTPPHIDGLEVSPDGSKGLLPH